MTTRTVGAWAAFVVAAGSLTGCTGGGGNSNYIRPNPAAAPKPAAPAVAQPTAAAPANGSAWGRQAQPAVVPAARTPGDPSALAAPTGNTPQFNSQPTGGITPSGGIAPPAPLPAATNVPAATAPAPGTSTSNLLPSGSSLNSLNAGTPVGAAPAPARQVAVNAIRPAEPGTRVSVKEPAPAAAPATTDDPPAALPPMPPAAPGSELPVQPPKPITDLSPLAPVTLPPTKVRQ